MMPVTDPAAFIETLLGDPEFRRELEEKDQRAWETFTLRLLAWNGESEELPPQPASFSAPLHPKLRSHYLKDSD